MRWYDQFSADATRATRGVGSSACAFVQSALAGAFLVDGTVDISRETLAKLVSSYAGPNDGDFGASSLRSSLGALGMEYELVEADPANLLEQILTGQGLASALANIYAKANASRVACLITVAPGQTMGLYADFAAAGVRLQCVSCIICLNTSVRIGAEQGMANTRFGVWRRQLRVRCCAWCSILHMFGFTIACARCSCCTWLCSVPGCSLSV